MTLSPGFGPGLVLWPVHDGKPYPGDHENWQAEDPWLPFGENAERVHR